MYIIQLSPWNDLVQRILLNLILRTRKLKHRQNGRLAPGSHSYSEAESGFEPRCLSSKHMPRPHTFPVPGTVWLRRRRVGSGLGSGADQVLMPVTGHTGMRTLLLPSAISSQYFCISFRNKCVSSGFKSQLPHAGNLDPSPTLWPCSISSSLELRGF